MRQRGMVAERGKGWYFRPTSKVAKKELGRHRMEGVGTSHTFILATWMREVVRLCSRDLTVHLPLQVKFSMQSL